LYYSERCFLFSAELLNSTPAKEEKAMGTMDNWDLTLLIVAGYVAVVALVRLMRRQRDHLLDEMRRQIAKEKKRRQNENDWAKSA
jgi:hypothetical protein